MAWKTVGDGSHLRREEAFHDGWASGIRPEDVLVDESFEVCTAPENRIIIRELGDLSGKKVLELGCGAGEASVYFAKRGADVTATDISGGMLETVQRVASLHGVTVRTVQTGSHQMPFNDGSFDIVYAANLLHHVEIESTLIEASRVLKPGGVFVSWDPLAHNPAINVYRARATEVRTSDEHPLRMKDLQLFRKHFSSVRTEATWLFTLWIFIKYYFIDRVDPNKERYWKKIIVEHEKIGKTYSRLERLDGWLLKLLPFMKRYCWNIVVMCVK